MPSGRVRRLGFTPEYSADRRGPDDRVGRSPRSAARRRVAGGASGHRASRAVEPASAGEEAQPDGPRRVVGVRVEQADRLPRPEREPAVDDRHGQRRRRQQRQDVVRAVARRPVPVAVQPVLARAAAGRARRCRSSSEPAPISTTTSPAVACGTKTDSRPSSAVDVRRGTRRRRAVRSASPRADPGPDRELRGVSTGRCSGARRGAGRARPSPAPTRSASARPRRGSRRPTGAARRAVA